MSEANNNLPGRFAVYGAAGGKSAVVARFEDNDVWLTQKQLADLFNTTKQNVGQHIRAIFECGELTESATVKKYFTMDENAGQVAKRPIYHCNLDMIIALGYRIEVLKAG